MSEEIRNAEGDVALLNRLRTVSELYVIMSACTREPYVECDPETFDDEVFLYFKKEDGEAQVKSLSERQIPVGLAKLEQQQMLPFYTSLYTMGVNAVMVSEEGHVFRIQLSSYVKRKEPEQKEGKVWVENPELHLTALYYMQEIRRGVKPDEEKTKELQEELLAHFGKGKYVVPMQQDGNQVPLVKVKNGDTYQPVFTDILEFQKFNKNNEFRGMVVEAGKLPQVVPQEARGVVLNRLGLNLPLPLVGRDQQN